jgi:hypothetical protein
MCKEADILEAKSALLNHVLYIKIVTIIITIFSIISILNVRLYVWMNIVLSRRILA